MNKELLEEINKGNISRVALFTQDESPILYTEKYVKEKDKEIERLNNIKQKAINELFDLKDMIYKTETREIDFDIQRKISSIIKILILGKELKGSDKE